MRPLLPVAGGGLPFGFFENLVKVAAVADAAGLGDSLHAFVAEAQQLLGIGDPLGQDIIAHRGTVDPLEFPGQMKFA